MAQKQPKTDRQSDPRNRLYKMVTRAKWWRKILGRQVTKEIRLRLAYHWQRYEELDAPQRQALDDYITTQERKIKLEHLLWEKGYRHGDHVLIYEPILGRFTGQVLTKFDDILLLMSLGMAAQYEIATEYARTQGAGDRIRPEDRTQRKSQPDLTCHETGVLIEWK